MLKLKPSTMKRQHIFIFTGESHMSFRVCIACYGIRVYPYVGFMTGQRYQCQDCLELMVIPIEFDEEQDYRDFVKAMKGDKND